MTIRFLGKKKPFECVLVDNPTHTDQRARWSDGYWADICTGCMEIFRRNLANAKASTNRLWFLGRKDSNRTGAVGPGASGPGAAI